MYLLTGCLSLAVYHHGFGNNSVNSGAGSRVVELNVSFRVHLNWNPVSATYKLCGLGRSFNHFAAGFSVK